MLARLAQLRALALRAKAGDDLERQMAASILVNIAASDWHDILPTEAEKTCRECGEGILNGKCRSEMCRALSLAEDAADRAYEAWRDQ